MLRTIKQRHNHPRLIGMTCTTVGGAAVTFGVGGQDLDGTCGAAGTTTITFEDPFSRAAVAVGSPGTDVEDGGFVHQDTIGTATGITIESAADNGTGDDGTSHAFILGWDSPHTEVTIPDAVRNTRNRARLELFKVTGTGTAAINIGAAHAALTDNGTGDYTLTFTRPFASTPVAVGCPVAATQKALTIESVATTAVNVKTFDSAKAAEDNIFYLAVLGWDTPHEVGGLRRALKTPQVKPRLEAFRIVSDALTIGSEDGTLAGATGDYTITLGKAFKREPIVLATAHADVRAQCDAVATGSVVNVASFDADGTAAAHDFDVIVVGFDDADDR